MSDQAAAQFNIHEAKTQLSRIIDRVEHGEEIVISRAGRPVAKVVPLTRTINRAGRGSLRGKLVAAPDWDSDEVNESIAADFGITPCACCSTPTSSCGG
jgi:prevent-host-death family protein